MARRRPDPFNFSDGLKHNCARSNYFPMSGLGRAQFDAQGKISIAPAFASARSPGSWSEISFVSAPPCRRDRCRLLKLFYLMVQSPFSIWRYPRRMLSPLVTSCGSALKMKAICCCLL